MMHRTLISAAFFTFVAAGAPIAHSAQAKSDLDGRWSVLIVTETGDCDRAYRYGVKVENGKIAYHGDSELIAVSLSGEVDRAGRVKVKVSSGDQVALATGRLSGRTGGGTWSGQSSKARCAGRWEAERRS